MMVVDVADTERQEIEARAAEIGVHLIPSGAVLDFENGQHDLPTHIISARQLDLPADILIKSRRSSGHSKS